MSIGALRESYPEFKDLTMRYEDGGKVQVYRIGAKEVRLGATATMDEVIAALRESE